MHFNYEHEIQNKIDEVYNDLYNVIINLDDQEINYDYLVGFPDSDEVFDDIIDTLEEWDYYPKANTQELDEKICHLILNHIYVYSSVALSTSALSCAHHRVHL